jgi:hypothetical protein
MRAWPWALWMCALTGCPGTAPAEVSALPPEAADGVVDDPRSEPAEAAEAPPAPRVAEAQVLRDVGLSVTAPGGEWRSLTPEELEGQSAVAGLHGPDGCLGVVRIGPTLAESLEERARALRGGHGLDGIREVFAGWTPYGTRRAWRYQVAGRSGGRDARVQNTVLNLGGRFYQVVVRAWCSDVVCARDCLDAFSAHVEIWNPEDAGGP